MLFNNGTSKGNLNYEDLCKEAQIATEKYTMRMIEKALDMSTCRNLVLSVLVFSKRFSCNLVQYFIIL